LSDLGRILARRFRAGDLRGRWGGEEFILAFPHTSSNTIKGAILRVLEEFKLHEFNSKERLLSGVSFSAGLAVFPGDGSSLKELLLCADKNLYTAKRTGRSRVCDTDEV
jgi:diguanylate cyclase (GGDEF)-like protein